MATIKSIQISGEEYKFNKLVSDNSVIEVDGDTIKSFGNKLQSGRFPDTSNSENLLVVGNGSSQDSTSNALELTYNGELKAQTEVSVDEHKLTEKLDKNDLPSASKGIGIFDIEGEEIILEQAGASMPSLVYGYSVKFPTDIENYIAIFLNFGTYGINGLFYIKDLYVGKVLGTYYSETGSFEVKITKITNREISISNSGGPPFVLLKVSIFKAQKHYQLSLSDKTDNQPFGYNPNQGTWQPCVKNDGGVESAVVMSKADYENLATKDPNKLYFLYE